MSYKKIIFILFFIALLSGFFWNQKMFGQPINGDQNSYNDIAQNILRGKGFARDSRVSDIEPFYPLFLSGIYKIFGHNYDTVRIIQIILFAITIVLIYLTAKMLFNEKIAFISALATALFYGLANQAGNIATETLFTFLIILFVYVISKYFHNWNYGSIWRLAVSGIVLGLAALTRGIVQFLPILIIASIFIFYHGKLPIKKISLSAGIFIAGFLLVLIPWVARNRSINIGAAIAPRGGEILLDRAELMENLYQNYPAHFIGHLFGYYFSQKIYPNVSSSLFRETSYNDKRVVELSKEGKNPAEIDSILIKEATAKILKKPHKYVLMSVLDFISFNSPIIPRGSLWQNTLTIHPMFAEGRHSNISELVKAAIILGLRFIWFGFFFFVIYGLIKNFKNPRLDGGASWNKIGWIFLIIIYFNLAYSAIHAIPRYALPIYPFYVTLAVFGFLNFLNMKNKTQMNGLLSPLLQRLRFKNALPFLRGISYLDIGCSLGEIIPHLPNGANYIGIEGNPIYYKEAIKKNPGYKFFNTYADGDNVNTLPIQKESFDTIIALAVIEHMSDPQGALRGLKRYLKRGGVIIISTPSRSTKWISRTGSKLCLFSDETREHKELFNKEQLINIAKKAGYKVVYFSTFEFGLNYLLVLTPEIQK